jgi:four helix bundle protein
MASCAGIGRINLSDDKKLPDQVRYALSVQVKRAAVSVVSNIAEGASRTGKKDQAHFYQMAYSSLMIVLCQLIVATDMRYINQSELLCCREKIELVARMLNNLRKTRFEVE